MSERPKREIAWTAILSLAVTFLALDILVAGLSKDKGAARLVAPAYQNPFRQMALARIWFEIPNHFGLDSCHSSFRDIRVSRLPDREAPSALCRHVAVIYL